MASQPPSPSFPFFLFYYLPLYLNHRTLGTNVDSENFYILSNYLLSILFLTCLFDTQDSCMKNKLNREKVRYPQCTCSQSYIIKAYILVIK
jgi:hypothetical protein